MKTVNTELLEIAYEEDGGASDPVVLILHGWPDAPRGWHPVNALLRDAGYRTVTPYLRGFGGTRFLSEATPRVGRAVALVQDAIDLLDALGLDRVAVVGHDWGARMAFTLAVLFPERISRIVALSTAYQPRGRSEIPSYEQARRYWYQWFQCVEGGAEKVTADPVGFAKKQWLDWSPEGWFTEEEFRATAESFRNPDWAAITLNSYRSRWRDGELDDPRYAPLHEKLAAQEMVGVPALMIQGTVDRCTPPSESEGRERYFTAGYRRVLMEGVGHFPHREAPERVAEAIVGHLKAAAI